MIGIGSVFNALCIVVGGLLGVLRKMPSAATQHQAKVLIGAATALCGLYLTWISLSGPFLHGLAQLGVVLLGLTMGKITGRILHLQKGSNRLGRFARDRIAAAKPDSPDRFSTGFMVCTILFCAAPLGILGPIHEGLSGYFVPLIIKGLMDGLAVLGFISIFGRGLIFSAVPVLVFQGLITLGSVRLLQPWLQAHELIDSVNATGGLLIFSVSLIVLEIRKVEVTDYLPALGWAPLLATWLGTR